MAAPEPASVLTVSALTAQIRAMLEGEFTSVWVSGEISNVTRASSGHIYLTLKDDAAIIGAVLGVRAVRACRGRQPRSDW